MLGQPYTCFDASKYSILFIVDSEDVFSAAERKKLQTDVDHHGLSVIVIAEWYDVNVMRSLAFNDDNTRRLWHVSIALNACVAIRSLELVLPGTHRRSSRARPQ